MDKMMEIVLDVIAVAILIIFLLYIVVLGNMNGNKGLLNALIDNPYQEIENDIEEDELVSSFENQMQTGSETFEIKYIGSVLEVYNPELKKGIYDIRELYEITYDDVSYEWNGITWSDGNGTDREFRFFVQNVKNEENIDVLSIKNLKELEDSEYITDIVMLDEDTYELVILSAGRYNVNLSITDKETGRIIKRKIAFPARVAGS